MQGDEQLVDILKIFENDQIDSAFEERSDLHTEALLTINLLLLGLGGRNSQRANPAGHECFLGSQSGQLRRLPVDFIYAIGKSMPSQFDGICSEGVCSDDVRAGVHIVGVNFPDQVGRGDAECLEAFIRRRTSFVEQRLHGAVSTERLIFNFLEEGHWVCPATCPSPLRTAPARSRWFSS